MKLFTKEIDTKLFEQYLTGSDLENQMVVAKIFNPYGRGTWYLLNSDPEDPEYLWAIVDMDDIEVGSVNRSDLENIRIKPFMLGLERDLSFRQMNALELYEGLNEGKKYLKGGSVEAENKEMVLNNNKQIAHHTEEMNMAVKNAKNVPAWVVAKVNRSATDLSDATHYMEGENKSYADGGGVGERAYYIFSKSKNTKPYLSKKFKTMEDLAEYINKTYGLSKVGVFDDISYGEIKKEGNAIIGWATSDANKEKAVEDLSNKHKLHWETLNYNENNGANKEIAEIKAKIEKAKKNTIMPENLKKQYIEKYEKQLAALTLDKGTKEDVKDFLEVPKGKTPKIVKVEPKGKVKVKEILIHWAEGDNSKYDKFPKTYKTWEAANKAIIPVYEDYAKDDYGGYNKVKFTVTFEDGENYDGRLDVSTREDNPTKTHNVIGQHIKYYLDYQLSEKSRTSEANKKEIIEWLEKYDLGLEKSNQTVTKKATPKKEIKTVEPSKGRTIRAVAQDKKRTAKKAGKRTAESGNTYYESRENRSDKSQKTRLEKGGTTKGWKHKKNN